MFGSSLASALTRVDLDIFSLLDCASCFRRNRRYIKNISFVADDVTLFVAPVLKRASG